MKLKDIDAPSGSIGVLRWVVGSCQAYLKETQPGEGILAGGTSSSYVNPLMYGLNNVKQFTFVVGSPEQEANFGAEIRIAQASDSNCKQYPTLLAFLWYVWLRVSLKPRLRGREMHNILRTGLDFQDTSNGRAYGNGVYFARMPKHR